MTDVLAAEEIQVIFGSQEVLRGFSLRLQAGQRHAITGANGAGKSTLLHVIAGNIAATGGRITLCGRNISGLAPDRIARLGVARTWQHPQLAAHLSIAANAVLGLSAHAAGNLPRLFSELGLAGSATVAAGNASHSVRRRADLAAALARSPKLLLLDEPTAGLSEHDIRMVVGVLQRAPAEMTMLIADHHRGFLDAVTDATTMVDLGRRRASSPLTEAAAGLSGADMAPAGCEVLRIRGLMASYGPYEVLSGVDLAVRAGEIVAIAGAGSSGKSTLLNALMGVHSQLSTESFMCCGQRADGQPAHVLAHLGAAYVPQSSPIFPQLTVGQHNVFAPGCLTGGKPALSSLVRLAPRQLAGTLSGGEQRILALTMALSRQPKLLMLDEPFEGLSAEATTVVAGALSGAAAAGAGILVVSARPLPVQLAVTRVFHLVAGRLTAAADGQ